MHVKKVLKTADGEFTFEGELTQAEHDIVMEVGLNALLEKGALPFTSIEKEKLYKAMNLDGDEYKFGDTQ